MNLPPEAWSALAGAFVVGLFSVVTTYINHQSEERKHFRDIITRVASENRNKRVDTGTSGVIAPLHLYIIHTAKMCDLAFDRNITALTVQSKLKEIDALMDVLYAHAVNETKKARSSK